MGLLTWLVFNKVYVMYCGGTGRGAAMSLAFALDGSSLKTEALLEHRLELLRDRVL